MVVPSLTVSPGGADLPLVLVVDDDDDSLTLIAYILEQMACRAWFAADGRAALGLAQQHRPQLILSDIHLPQLDGYSFLRQIRADANLRHIPVVAVTALATAGDREKILAAGFDDYLSKPFLVDALVQLVERFIGLSTSPA